MWDKGFLIIYKRILVINQSNTVRLLYLQLAGTTYEGNNMRVILNKTINNQ